MRFSIITPSFNQAVFLNKTIASVINQKGDFELQYIVMDGGSTDNSVEILKKIEKKLKGNKRIRFIWRSKKDKGQSDAINQGLRLATGDIVAFLNSDDVYCKGTLQKVANTFKNSSLNWVTGFCQIIDENGNHIQAPIMKYKNFWLRRYSYKKLQVLNFISQPSTFWRRELLKKHGLFQEDLHYAMDYDYWLRIGKNNDPVVIKEPLACFRIHSTSKSKTEFIKQFDQDMELCLKYTSSKILIFLHSLHNRLIRTVYRIIK